MQIWVHVLLSARCGGLISACNLQGDPTKQVQLRGHDDQITAFAMSSNGTMLASGQRGANSDVVVWDARSLSQKFRCGWCGFEQQGTYSDLDSNSDNDTIQDPVATVQLRLSHLTCCATSADAYNVQRSLTFIPCDHCTCRFQEHDIEICALGFSRDEKLLVTVGNEK